LALLEQRLAADAEDGGRLRLLAAREVEHFGDVRALELLERLLAGSSATGHVCRQVFGADLRAGTVYDRALQDVAQLADVSRKRVPLERTRGRRRKHRPGLAMD